jgi:hypothetical protein
VRLSEGVKALEEKIKVILTYIFKDSVLQRLEN